MVMMMVMMVVVVTPAAIMMMVVMVMMELHILHRRLTLGRGRQQLGSALARGRGLQQGKRVRDRLQQIGV